MGISPFSLPRIFSIQTATFLPCNKNIQGMTRHETKPGIDETLKYWEQLQKKEQQKS